MAKVKNFDEFISEAWAYTWDSASLFNTNGMGNVVVGHAASGINHVESGDQDKTARHLKMHERTHKGDSWMRPSGDYSNRNWLVPNYEIFQNQRQSNARFQIGEAVRCINPEAASYGMSGKIVAFEDNTIRWEATNSKTGVGQTARQYRCHAATLQSLKESQPNC